MNHERVLFGEEEYALYRDLLGAQRQTCGVAALCLLPDAPSTFISFRPRRRGRRLASCSEKNRSLPPGVRTGSDREGAFWGRGRSSVSAAGNASEGADSGHSGGDSCRRASRPTATYAAAICYVRFTSKPVKLIRRPRTGRSRPAWRWPLAARRC